MCNFHLCWLFARYVDEIFIFVIGKKQIGPEFKHFGDIVSYFHFSRMFIVVRGAVGGGRAYKGHKGYTSTKYIFCCLNRGEY